MNIVLVYNAHSGSALSAKVLQQKCAVLNITIKKMIKLEDGYEAKLRPYIKKDQIIAVVGGDGSVGSVANQLIGADVLFAPLPGGTLNHFTKDIGIEQDIDKALAQLTAKKIVKVDAAKVNGQIFLNNSSIGLYPTSLRAREHFENHLGKWPAAVIGSLRALVRYRVYDMTISGQDVKTPFVFIGNNEYKLEKGGTRAHVNKGVLSVYAIEATGRWQLVKLLGWAIVGKLSDAPEIKTWSAQTVTIKSGRQTLHVSRDGEHEHLETPLVYEIMPGVLKVIGSS